MWDAAVKALSQILSPPMRAILWRSIALALVAGGRDRMGQTLYVPMPNGTIEVEVTGMVFVDEKGERLNG